MASRLIESLATTDELADIFSDRSVLAAMLEFEVALARLSARLGIIPLTAADNIAQASAPEAFDAAALAQAARKQASIAIPFVRTFTELVHAIDPDSAQFVHWGATSQDLLDTALVLLLRRAQIVFARNHSRMESSLRALSDQHAGTIMLARTLLQPAPPITFGYKVAGWYGATHRSWARLYNAFEEATLLQFGGAAGTLASYGEHAAALADGLGKELNLPIPEP